jgi:hypothetical protein
VSSGPAPFVVGDVVVSSHWPDERLVVMRCRWQAARPAKGRYHGKGAMWRVQVRYEADDDRMRGSRLVGWCDASKLSLAAKRHGPEFAHRHAGIQTLYAPHVCPECVRGMPRDAVEVGS